MDDLDVTLGEHEARMLEMNSAYETLSERLAELIEARHVLRETAVFFRRVSALCGCCTLKRNSFPI
jgi:V-type H+-transporting ATPase subunit a